MGNIPLQEIYQHNLNFLIGSGASSGLFPTLWVPLKDSDDDSKNETIETLATKLDKLSEKDPRFKNHHSLLFMYYYEYIIKPICQFKTSDIYNKQEHQCIADGICNVCKEEDTKKTVLDNYKTFIISIVKLLQQKNSFKKHCNLFTTNYDGCIPFIADELIQEGRLEFHINDGSNGFIERTLSARNFNRYQCQTGVFGRNSSDIPQINYINLHGSGFWRKSGDMINVDYKNSEHIVTITAAAKTLLDQFANILNDQEKKTSDLTNTHFELSKEDSEAFWDSYNQLPIVNPTKWKFHETVFEEHYYQMLRFLSYSLEEQNSVLISFAFSFADEHIRNLIKRSLSNHTLQIFICCFNNKDYIRMQEYFNCYENVKLITLDDHDLDFTKFNSDVFNAEVLKEVTP
ncbi:hypothetical protein [Aeromonas hydrophila]|uniref:hypothetical protein n=1 Tax=Aeromonas hydrophila TaxID=644 RepID=UPI0009BB1BC0|nr:hypothetical protein [Aeromonas hydrophila]